MKMMKPLGPNPVCLRGLSSWCGPDRACGPCWVADPDVLLDLHVGLFNRQKQLCGDKARHSVQYGILPIQGLRYMSRKVCLARNKQREAYDSPKCKQRRCANPAPNLSPVPGFWARKIAMQQPYLGRANYKTCENLFCLGDS